MMSTFSLTHCTGIIFSYFQHQMDDQHSLVCQRYLSHNSVIYHLRHQKKAIAKSKTPEIMNER